MSAPKYSKNDQQIYFNQIRGILESFSKGDNFINLVLKVGHEKPRHVAFVGKMEKYADFEKFLTIGSKIIVHFFPSSKEKNQFWYTSLNILEIKKDFEE